MVRARVRPEHSTLGTRPLTPRAGAARPASLTPGGVLGLQRSIGNHAVTRLLQRVPTARVTQRAMSHVRLPGGTPKKKAEAFEALRARHRENARAILNDLEFDHLWGNGRSDVTNTGDDYSVRIDRQNPTQTASNVQIQTNGDSVTIATVLVSDDLFRGDRVAVIRAVVHAFRMSLDDGMQWEVYDEQVEAKPEVYVKGGKGGGKGGGKWDKKGGGQGKKGGGQGKQGGGGRSVLVQ